MIKSFITYTPEEETERKNLHAQREALYAKIKEHVLGASPAKARELSRESNTELDRIARAEIRIIVTARNRYISELRANQGAAIENIKEISAAYTKEDFLSQMEPTKRSYESYVSQLKGILSDPSAELSEEMIKGYKRELAEMRRSLSIACRRNFSSAYHWISVNCSDELKAIENNESAENEAVRLIRKKAAQLYTPRYGEVDSDPQQEMEQLSLAEVFAPIDGESGSAHQDMIEWLNVTRSPDKFVSPNNKLANTLTNPALTDGQEHPLFVGSKGKKEVNTLCVLDYEGDNVKLTGKQEISEYDRTVYDGTCSIYEYGDITQPFTAQMVYRAFTGSDVNPTPQQVGAVTKSLEKLRFYRCRINCTEELIQRNATLDGEQITNGVYDTYLLALEAFDVTTNGDNKVRAYRFIRKPVLYDYAAKVGQVLTTDRDIIDIKRLDKAGRITTRSLSNTESRIAIRSHLLRQVERIRGGEEGSNKTGNIISFVSYRKGGESHPGLYEIAGYKDITKDSAKNVRDYTAQVLDFWKAKGFIKSWSFAYKGNSKTITGVKVLAGGKYKT